MRAIVFLDGEPRFQPYPFAPPLEGPVRRAVDDAAGVLARTSRRFDGPVAFCHGVARDGAILRRKGRYAEAMVVFEEPTLAYRLGFALGVQLFVERPEGATLFQLRGPSIGRDPLLWTASASGGLRPGQEPREAILADAAEEIGLGEDDLLGFGPVAVVTSDDTGSALVVYGASLREGAEPEPDPVKVAELAWVRDPEELGAQVSADALAAWDAVARRRAERAEEQEAV
ncbi:MAG: NUDIX domain-containing protein [Gaiellaceae bacterium]